MQSKEDLQKLIDTIEGADNTKDVREWLECIANPESQLVSKALVEYNKNRDSNEEFCEALLKLLVLLLERIPDVVEPQIAENILFGETVINYLKTTSLDKVSGYAFVLLSCYSRNGLFDNLIDSSLITKLFDSLSIINNNFIALSIIQTIICSAMSTDSPSSDSLDVIKHIHSHQNRKYFQELLALLLNHPRLLMKSPTYRFIAMYNQNANIPLFYLNDLKIVISILLAQLEDTITDAELGPMCIECLESLLATDEYQENKFYQTQIMELSAEFLASDLVPEENLDQFNNLLNLIN